MSMNNVLSFLFVLLSLIGCTENKNSFLNVYPKVCKQGLIEGPHKQFGVFIFCDDAVGTTIGIINLPGYVLSYGELRRTSNSEWDKHKRFWQEKEWALDVESVQWSEDGLSLTVNTGYIYGTDNCYVLDLPNKRIKRVDARHTVEKEQRENKAH